MLQNYDKPLHLCHCDDSCNAWAGPPLLAIMPAPSPPDAPDHAPYCAFSGCPYPPHRPGGALAGPADAGRHPHRGGTALRLWPARHYGAGVGALCSRRAVYAGRGLYLAAGRPCTGGCVFTQLATIPPAMGGTARYSVITDP